VPVQKHAELIDSVGDLMLVENVHIFLRGARPPEHLVHGEHRIVAGVIGVVASRAIERFSSLAEREVVGDRNRLLVGDQKTLLGLWASTSAPGYLHRAGACRLPRHYRFYVWRRSAGSIFRECPSQAPLAADLRK